MCGTHRKFYFENGWPSEKGCRPLSYTMPILKKYIKYTFNYNQLMVL